MGRKYSLLAFTVITAVLLLWLHSNYPLGYIYRVMTWQDADYYDFEKLPARLIEKPAQPFQFDRLNQEDSVATKFEAYLQIDDFEQFLAAKQTNAFVVIKDTSILYEGYFNGNTRESVQSSFSVSKSLLSALIGIALSEKHIGSLDDPIQEYLPELKDRNAGFGKITIAHVLKMRSGFGYTNDVAFPIVNADPPLTYYHPDLRSVALEKSRIVAEPDSVFRYNNYNALLIGLVLERATGQSVSAYFEEKIWHPIGAAYDASWSTDANGFEQMQTGFNGRPIDFAKIGWLFLNKGTWGDQALIPADWVEASTQLDSLSQDPDQYNARRWYYRYFWWGIPRTNAVDDFIAIGRFGQFIYVSPINSVVIVRNGPGSGEWDDRDWTELFFNVVDRL